MWHFSKFTSHLCNHVTKGRCIVTVPPEDIAHCALLPRPESPRHCWSSLGPWRTRTRRRGAGTRGHGGNSQPIRGRRGLGWTNGRPGQGHVTRAGHGGTRRPISGRAGRSIMVQGRMERLVSREISSNYLSEQPIVEEVLGFRFRDLK